MNREEKILGGILGVVVGDALGLPVQFLYREEVRQNPVKEMTGYGTFNTPPGTWSDDSSLTLCLVESLCEAGYDLLDIGNKFLHWYNEGYWTPFGEAFDIGGATHQAMLRLMAGVDPLNAGPAGERNNGNGSLMRILPAVLYFSELEDQEMMHKVCQVSRITHGHPRSQLACCLYALVVKGLLIGNEPVIAYKQMLEKVNRNLIDSDLVDELPHYKRILNGALPGLPERAIKSSGYVVDTLEAALWCFLNNNNFTDTLLTAVNLGKDTDTVGAVTGGLAGVYYGYGAIPEEWIRILIRSEEIMALTERFAAVVTGSGPTDK